MPVVTPSHVQLFEYMYQSLEMDAELIEFFLDYCCSPAKDQLSLYAEGGGGLARVGHSRCSGSQRACEEF